MCPNPRNAEHDLAAIGSPPCRICDSMNHSTPGHFKLEDAYRRWGLGLSPLAPQEEIDFSGGSPGVPSPSTPDSGRPDLLRIVPCTISELGSVASQETAPAVLRLWRQDPEGGFTFTLSLAQSKELALFLAALCGAPGSIASVGLRFSRTIRTVERAGT